MKQWQLESNKRFIVVSHSQKLFDSWYIVLTVIHTFSYLWAQVDIMLETKIPEKMILPQMFLPLSNTVIDSWLLFASYAVKIFSLSQRIVEGLKFPLRYCLGML